MNVLPPTEPIETIRLEASVRELVNEAVKLVNPVDVPVYYFITCGSSEIKFEKEVTVQPYTTVSSLRNFRG